MELRGVRINNLQSIDVSIPWGKIVAISGVSGSGKSSLAFDTLFAEGQRRYLESLSPRARAILDQLPQPDADHIDPLPPALAVRQNARVFPRRATVGSATEIAHSLQLLYAKVGRLICPTCHQRVQKETPLSVLQAIQSIPTGQRFQIAFPVPIAGDDEEQVSEIIEDWKQRGFTRGILGNTTVRFDPDPITSQPSTEDFLVVVDRLTAGKTSDARILDSLESAFSHGTAVTILLEQNALEGASEFLLDGKAWWRKQFHAKLQCGSCGREFPEPEPRSFNPNSRFGACPACDGMGTVREFSLENLVPDPGKSLDEGAIVCFREASLSEREFEWRQQAELAGVPGNLAFSTLDADQKMLLAEGDTQQDFAGLKQIFASLAESKTGKTKAFMRKWMQTVPCQKCLGQRLQEDALAVFVAGENFGDVTSRSLADFQRWLLDLPQDLLPHERELIQVLLVEIQSRVEALLELGLGYLSLGDSLGSISAGESQRVALTRILGHQLVESLFVFDEPSSGLHPADCENVVKILRRLQQAGNTLILVEHEPDFLDNADYLIDLGPGAGREGGQVVFQGLPADIHQAQNSRTGDYLSGRKSIERAFRPDMRSAQQATLKLSGASRFPLKHLAVEFPLNCLCVLTGVSGSGKTVLLEDTLYPAVQYALGQPIPGSLRERFGDLTGADAIDEVVLLDQTPLSGSQRGNAATYLNCFDDIRRIFAETADAKKQGFETKAFSFNSPTGGRCPACAGQGEIGVDMQFLPDLQIVCPECQGTRYKPEILSVRYRGLNIAEVLQLTIAEAFAFFRTHPRVQQRLQILKEVGLDYLPLGQTTASLSGGESQRLKLAGHLSQKSRSRTLFLFDEPTSGLHPADIQQLLNCFDQMLAVGHSIIVAEHNLHLIRQADWIVDLGPGAAVEGGEIVAAGPPEAIAKRTASLTGKCLRDRDFS